MDDFACDPELDIVDQQYPFETELNCHLHEHEIPLRPASRLSFNRPMIDSLPYTEEETIMLHSRSFSRMSQSKLNSIGGIETTSLTNMDMDITALASASDVVHSGISPSFLSLSSPQNSNVKNAEQNDIEDDDEQVSDIESDADCFSSEFSDDEDDTHSPRLSPDVSSDPSASLFNFPQLNQDAWTIRPKFSCLPSPLSPKHTRPRPFSFRHIPHRHFYRQHGYSRHALHHHKWFWATREEHWIEHKAQLRDIKAYGGLSIFRDLDDISTALRFPGHALLGSTGIAHPRQEVSPPLPPMSIHPRRGDVFALRDPYTAHIDRYFVGMPLWTMGKMLWMYDVHMGMEARARSVRVGMGRSTGGTEIEDDFFEEESMGTSASVISSDDSDVTLVESENDEDISRSEHGGDETLENDVELVKRSSFLKRAGTLSSEAIAEYSAGDVITSAYSSRVDLELGLFSVPPTPRQPSACLDQVRPPWITCWYRRWDLLLDLIRTNRESCNSSAVRSPSPRSKLPKFYFADDDSWDESSIQDNKANNHHKGDIEDISIVDNPPYWTV